MIALKLNLLYTETIVYGAFNPRIIVPTWLRKFNVCNQIINLEDEIELDQPEDFITFSDYSRRFKAGRMHWTVDFKHVCIRSADEAKENPSHAASKLVDLLKHTPVDGVEHSFVYECPTKQWQNFYPLKLPLKVADAELGVTDFSWNAQYASDKYDLSVSVFSSIKDRSSIDENEEKDENTLVVFTYNRIATRDDEKKISEAINCFSNDLGATRTLINQLFGASVND